jgi:hypothetical protein
VVTSFTTLYAIMELIGVMRDRPDQLQAPINYIRLLSHNPRRHSRIPQDAS